METTNTHDNFDIDLEDYNEGEYITHTHKHTQNFKTNLKSNYIFKTLFFSYFFYFKVNILY